MKVAVLHQLPLIGTAMTKINAKYEKMKGGSILIKLIFSIIKLFFQLSFKLIHQIQNYNLQQYIIVFYKSISQLVFVYATPALYQQVPMLYNQLKINYLWTKESIIKLGSIISKIYGNMIQYINNIDTPNYQSINLDSPNMNTLIDLLTRSLSELQIRENNNFSLELSSDNEYQQPSIVELPSTSYTNDTGFESIICSDNSKEIVPALQCIKDIDVDQEDMMESTFNNNATNIEILKMNELNTTNETTIINYDRTVITNPNTDPIGNCTEQTIVGETIEKQNEYDWKTFYPSCEPIIEMMTEEHAFKLAKSLKEKRQDRTGRDAYEVDTVLVLLSQWSVLDDKSKHYAVDRANLLYLAICYGWSFALQKLNPETASTATVVVTKKPSMNNNNNNTTNKNNNKENLNFVLKRQFSNDNINNSNNNQHSKMKKLQKNDYISKSHGSVHSNDSRGRYGHYQNHSSNNYGRNFYPRSNDNINYYRRSFPPNLNQKHFASSTPNIIG